MPRIHEETTITSKGQITLPKSIRQALGVDVGSKVAFDLTDSRVVVSRVEASHQDPSIQQFLTLLEHGIQSGKNISALPDDLARSMLDALQQPVDLDEEITGDVTL